MKLTMDHTGWVKPEVVEAILEHIKEKKAFVLYCEDSVILYNPIRLEAYWHGEQKADFSYPDLRKFIDAVNLHLVSHNQFIGFNKLNEIAGESFSLENVRPDILYQPLLPPGSVD